MKKGLGLAMLAAMAVGAGYGEMSSADDSSAARIKRGEYLVGAGSCNDCHSPKIATANGPAPDPARLLSGHPAGMALPPVPSQYIGPASWGGVFSNDLTAWSGPWGTSFSANLTPDMETGIGGWTAEVFIQAMRTGKHLGVGRDILPPMPWFNLARLSDDDLKAIFAYLKSLPPVRNAVPAPIPPRGR
jgi:mono/diheme cytochrome c family protein